MPWSGTARPNGMGGYDISGNPTGGSGGSGGAIFFVVFSLILLGSVAVGLIHLWLHNNAVEKATSSPVTLKLEGIVNRSWAKVALDHSFDSYHLRLHVNIHNISGDKHAVILCSPRVSTAIPGGYYTPAYYQKCFTYTLMPGARIQTTINQHPSLQEETDFKVWNREGVVDIDNHPVLGIFNPMCISDDDATLQPCR
jgi:hypothetical protein